MSSLNVQTVPLQGTHLIEASAGTGKTYNITRVYLRMLLERELSVEQILVMTFTKDATQELKGRIEATIREALNNWDTLVVEDDLCKSIANIVPSDKAKLILRKALLFLDEAAIFTIHGFCQRILSEYAFDTGMPFNVVLQPDISEIIEQACQDWYRLLAQSSCDDFLLLAQFWPTPDQFLASFIQAIMRDNEIEQLTPEMVALQAQTMASQALAPLNEHDALIQLVLISSQKADKQTSRLNELANLKAWLSAAEADINHLKNVLPSEFFNGTRYSRSAHKEALLAVFAPVKALKAQQNDLLKNHLKAQAYRVVISGIEKIRENISKEKTQQNLLSFDDLIASVAHSLSSNALLAKQIQQAFPVALVDEFQDTDPAQFTILSALYQSQEGELAKSTAPVSSTTNNISTSSTSTNSAAVNPALYMIGDPKQAIYGFRGGDVFAYLSSRKHCQYQWLMDTNWRSSKQMIAGYNRLFYGAELTEKSNKVFGFDIPYQPVKASPFAKPELADTSEYKALQFVHFIEEDEIENVSTSKKSTSKKNQNISQESRKQMANWCSAEIIRLLSQPRLALQPQDFAILVRDGAEALTIKESLNNAGLASVYLSNRQNLFESAEAQQLFILLQGIYYCDNERLYSQALASPLFAYQAKNYFELQQSPQQWQVLKEKIENLRQLWLNKGFMAMAFTLLHEHIYLPEHDHERCLTNLIHLFETLQLSSNQQAQPHQLLHWLQQHVYGQVKNSEVELRLESDDNLIKIVTQHGCKGLEYPVVFIPFATRYKNPLKAGIKNRELIEYHDEQHKHHLSLGGSVEAKQAMINESHAESIRLFYVAITRAEQRCYVLTANFADYTKSPLGCTLQLSENKHGDNAQLSSTLLALAQNSEAIGFSLENLAADVLTLNLPSYQPKETVNADYVINQFTGHIERDWWLSSFTALTRNISYSSISRPDHDESQQEEVVAASSELRFLLTKGAQTGNFLHDIFERLDFNQPNWQEAIAPLLIKYGLTLNDDDQKKLITWLKEIITTELNNKDDELSLTSDLNNHLFSLSDITFEHTLRECEFYFPMEDVSMVGLRQVLMNHRRSLSLQYQQPNKQALNKQPILEHQINNIQLPMKRKLKGLMHGFIDLIFKANGKYFVCDYKSNHLGDDYSAYQKLQLHDNIEQHYYDLQYLIYSLALHRYLQLHLPDYQPERDFGGVYYLYLRGMKTQNGKTTGVYFHKITEPDLMALDDLFTKNNTKNNTNKNTNKSKTESNNKNNSLIADQGNTHA